MAEQVEATSRRSQRRLQHQDLSRQQLLDAAEEVFGRKGFHETTLKEVAELAEFSVGSVYSFFESKDDLFRQIFARRGEELLYEMESVLDGPAHRSSSSTVSSTSRSASSAPTRTSVGCRCATRT